MADGGIGNQSPATIFQARLDTSDGAGAVLTLRPYIGNKVAVSGVTVPIPSSGLTRNVADHLIDGAGADSGAAGVANTLYYVYISNSRATFSPSAIRLSSQAPSLVNGVKYLGSSGNALNWRFVGWVLLNATPQFESTLLNRFIVNYYNRLLVNLYVNPGYVDDNTPTSYPTASTTFVTLSSMVGSGSSRLSFISNGEDAVQYAAAYSGVTANININYFAGIGEDSVSQAAVMAIAPSGQGAENSSISLSKTKKFAEGLHTLDMLFATNALTSSFYADLGRIAGGAADAPATVLSAIIAA